MKTYSSPATTILGSLVLAVVAAWLAFGIVTGTKPPVISGERVAFIAFLAVAIALCGLGIGRVSATGQWLHPLAMIGYILGSVALLILAAGLFGFAVPYVHDGRDVVIALSAIMTVKFVVSFIHMLIWK